MSHKVFLTAGLVVVLLVSLIAPAAAAPLASGGVAPGQRAGIAASDGLSMSGIHPDGGCEIPGATECPPPR